MSENRPQEPFRYRLSAIQERAANVAELERIYWEHSTTLHRDRFLQAVDRLVVELLTMRDSAA